MKTFGFLLLATVGSWLLIAAGWQARKHTEPKLNVAAGFQQPSEIDAPQGVVFCDGKGARLRVAGGRLRMTCYDLDAATITVFGGNNSIKNIDFYFYPLDHSEIYKTFDEALAANPPKGFLK